jgi:uncharacterized membrane protein HdeD (DUF308 family)
LQAIGGVLGGARNVEPSRYHRSAQSEGVTRKERLETMQSLVDGPDIDEVRGGWGWFVGFGVVLLVLGLIALWNAVDATLVTAFFVGVALLVGGVVEVIGAFTVERSGGMRVLHGVLGVLYVLGGLYMIVNPVVGAITVAVVVAIMLIADGILKIWFAFTRETKNRVWLGVIGVIDILLGVWLWTGIPVTAVAIGFYVGFMLVMAGVMWIIVGFQAKSLPDQRAAA